MSPQPSSFVGYIENYGIKDTLIVLLAKTTHPLSPLINSPDSIGNIKGLTYLSDYGVIRICLGGAM